jgi:hypothetical protein
MSFDSGAAPGHACPVRLHVECYAGYKGAQEPRAIVVDGERRRVLDVADRWFGPDGAYFQVRADDGHTYLLRLDRRSDDWELVRVTHQDA